MTSDKHNSAESKTSFSFSQEKLQSTAVDLRMWLFLATASIALWHGVLNHRLEGEDSITTAFFWLTALFLLWKQRDTLRITPQPLGTTIGVLLLAWILFRGSVAFWFEHDLVQLLPVIAFFALTLIASGWKGLNQYFRSFLALFIFSLGGVLIELFFKSNPMGFDFAQLTAQFSAFLLHYIGYDVAQQGVYIDLTQGSVEVLYFCTGGPLIALLFQLTLVLMLITPISWNLLSKLLLGIISGGFILGVIRVALLAVVVSDQEAFDYWHGSEGNQIFSLVAFSIWIVAAHFIQEYYDQQVSSPTVGNDSEETKDDDEELPENEINREETVTTFSLQSPRSWLIPMTGIVMLVATAITVIIPDIGRREIQPLSFPIQLSLAGWNLEKSQSLVENPETKLRLHRLRSGQKYQYQKPTEEVTVALRFFSPTHGNVESYLKRNYDDSITEAFLEGETRSFSKLGNYHLFSDDQSVYLSACIRPQGKSTVTVTEYVNQTNAGVFRLEGIIPRLLGKRSLRERRCLWVHLSTPLQGDSLEAKEEVLEQVFQKGYSQWQGLF